LVLSIEGSVERDELVYERLRRKYLGRGVTLEDLFNYFEMGRKVDDEVKKKIKEIIKEQGLSTTLLDFWKWMDLAEKYNPDELRFLSDP